MRNIKIDGVGNVNGGEYDNIEIDGVCNIKEEITAKDIKIGGVFECTAKVEAENITCEGVGNFKAPIRAERVDITGVMNMKGAPIEAKSIICEGVLTSNSELNADKVVIDGRVKAKEIYGEEVYICKDFGVGRIFNKLFNISNSLSKVELIEATNVKINNIKVKVVNGQNVTIGEFCDIEEVDCTGNLIIHPNAKVGIIHGAAHYIDQV